MASIIHFFRNRSLDRFDYEQLINHFTELENCEIRFDDEVYEMECIDPNFDFHYRFMITKRSRVNSIYNLNPNLLEELTKLVKERLAGIAPEPNYNDLIDPNTGELLDY